MHDYQLSRAMRCKRQASRRRSRRKDDRFKPVLASLQTIPETLPPPFGSAPRRPTGQSGGGCGIREVRQRQVPAPTADTGNAPERCARVCPPIPPPPFPRLPRTSLDGERPQRSSRRSQGRSHFINTCQQLSSAMWKAALRFACKPGIDSAFSVRRQPE